MRCESGRISSKNVLIGVKNVRLPNWPWGHGFESWKQSLAEKQGKAVYKRPKWSDPSPDPAQAGATCTGLPFLPNWEQQLKSFRVRDSAPARNIYFTVFFVGQRLYILFAQPKFQNYFRVWKPTQIWISQQNDSGMDSEVGSCAFKKRRSWLLWNWSIREPIGEAYSIQTENVKCSPTAEAHSTSLLL